MSGNSDRSIVPSPFMARHSIVAQGDTVTVAAFSAPSIEEEVLYTVIDPVPSSVSGSSIETTALGISANETRVAKA